jgi:hypothetical protein
MPAVILSFGLLVAVILPVLAHAQSKEAPPAAGKDARPGPPKGAPGGPPREPPPQAYVDCKGKAVGTKLQIHPPQGGAVDAECVNSDKGMFARPMRPPGPPGQDGGQGMPPPAERDAAPKKK